ncbi:MAG: cag pathogenicity island protein Cag26 [bacterium]|nr:cag pathogenicity island protein Cag26 [bacterium]
MSESKPPLWVQRLFSFLRRENLHRILIFLFLLSLLSAASLWSLEPDKPLRDWIWWSIVTLTTVGYGDITPTSSLGRIIGVALMLCGIGVLSIFTATIASFFLELKLRSQRGMDQLQLEGHFILCEWNQRAREVLRELRHDRRATAPIVLLADIDSKPVTDDDVYFIRGDVTEENLERANVDTAATVIILGDDKLDPSSRDAKVVLSTLTVETLNRDAYTIVELVREENARHCRRAHADEIIVGNEFSSRLIASAAVDHGISKVLSEILSARSGNELQKVALSASQTGQPFLEVLTEMKRANSSTVVAVQRGNKVMTNPAADLTLEAADLLIVIADPSAG